MKTYIRSIILLIAFLFTSFAYASATDDLVTLLNGITSMQANFVQTGYTSRGKGTQKSYGRMSMQRPGKFRWDVSKPIPQIIIANQTRLWIYDPDLEQVTIRSLQKAAGESPALLLSHDNSKLEESYVINTMTSDKPAWQWFALKPKQKDNMFEAIELGFNNHQIQEMRLRDNLGHKTVIQFQNIKTNIALASSLFNFKPSAKIDVIDETRKK